MTYQMYFLLMLTNVYAFVYPHSFKHHNHLTCIKSMSNEYLDKINDYSDYLNNDKIKVKKLEKIRNNITNYIKTKTDDKSKKIELGFKSTYQPIPKAEFDTIFMNINNIIKIYMSSNVDRMIFELATGKRYVYYINNKDDYTKMDQLIRLIPSKHKIVIINDIQNVMDDPFGFLYCDKK